MEILSGDVAEAVKVVTRKCRRDLRNLDVEPEEIPGLVRYALTNGRYRASVWCLLSEDRNRANTLSWAACDDYIVSRSEWIPQSGRRMDIEFYVKFAIGQSGSLLLLISYHPSGNG